MKVLVVSDSHGWGEILTELKGRYENKVDAMFHCGDSELLADDPEMDGWIVVRGNCDTEQSYPNDLTEEIEGVRIFMTHGHRYNVKMSLMNLQYKAEEHQADLAFFGHSHLIGAEKIGQTIFLNPGSITLPRGRSEKTYAMVERNRRETIIRFFDHKHRELTDLQQTFAN
ncbi:putative phosphoesterase [Bacillus ectoiniformans]|uniref:metallophosphoesterase n=1 Tax=Bacillus ectoiniformans TaxID=1494429 RepID=UPI001958F738|nr:metallophosphoesterase [Bacillus ectoiniformans]MBM7648908.1 putative phosphoesterase [Bacillus ectoiniformans]